MADYDLPAAIEESAKAVQSVSETSRMLGGFMARIVESPLTTAFAIVDDRLKAYRAERIINYYVAARERLLAAGLDPDQVRLPSPSIEVPLLTAASMEDRDELCRLWEALLAAAMAPRTRDRVRAKHIETLRSLEPLDALLLSRMGPLIEEGRRSPANAAGFFADDFENLAAHIFDCDKDEILTSIEHLAELKLVVRQPPGPAYVTPTGRTFLAVVSGPNVGSPIDREQE